MKSFLKTGIILSCLAALISIACNKPEVPPASNSITQLSGPPPKPSGYRIGNREYFWGLSWDTTSTGFIIRLDTYHLTQQAISWGIDVGIAIFGAGDSPWVTIPTSLYDYFLQDSVHLSYSAIPGQLQLKARTSFDMTKVKSEVYIEYK